MHTLSRHYHQLVGMNSDSGVASVGLDVKNRTLTLAIEFVGGMAGLSAADLTQTGR